MNAELVERLRAELGDAGVLTDPAATASYLTDWRGAWSGTALAVVRPASTAEVSAVLRLCSAAGVAVVPQGGNTGLCGGAVPDASGAEVVLSLTRMRAVLAVDPAELTVTVEAGAVLQAVQEAAAAVGCLYPVSLGSEGSATIGGTIATNAGGTGVLRWGNTRAQVLGLEVVLPDGRVWDGLRALRKDNTGYDLTQLFIGAEGTLGVVTRAVLSLVPALRSSTTAWAALPSVQAAVDLLGLLRRSAGDRVTAVELVSRQALELVLTHVAGARDPFAEVHPWYVLLELGDARPDAGLDALLEDVLGQAVEQDLVADAVVASSSAQVAALWTLREGISEAQNPEGPSLKHDVTVPVGVLPEFVAATDAALRVAAPGVRLVTYGHVGDGNLHYNLTPPVDADPDAFAARAHELADVVYREVARRSGSISAEHGIGQAKREALAVVTDEVTMDLMRGLKTLLDPRGLMNPGKVL
ncbi:FAD-binding oxidoreductase [Modestobacter sp. Leaf380]|uniref:FAD-binding oxidoreductase n=1 Tax=Modestobacter sp. Leaf380 TaxID=1736356 RepID=UPI0006F49E58|nr:FAD-binding oxidoreductase [Modestobacter sp. Leaf380]KQS71145.1 hydroxyacid dehydrogenase [Modestobacter sp. Leaf380]